MFTSKDSDKRKEICDTCEHKRIALNSVEYCDKCKCLIPLKVQVPKSKCPMGRW